MENSYLQVILEGMADNSPTLEYVCSLFLDDPKRLSFAACNVFRAYARPAGPVVCDTLLLANEFVHEHIALVVDYADPAMALYMMVLAIVISYAASSANFEQSLIFLYLKGPTPVFSSELQTLGRRRQSFPGPNAGLHHKYASFQSLIREDMHWRFLDARRPQPRKPCCRRR